MAISIKTLLTSTIIAASMAVSIPAAVHAKGGAENFNDNSTYKENFTHKHNWDERKYKKSMRDSSSPFNELVEMYIRNNPEETLRIVADALEDRERKQKRMRSKHRDTSHNFMTKYNELHDSMIKKIDETYYNLTDAIQELSETDKSVLVDTLKEKTKLMESRVEEILETNGLDVHNDVYYEEGEQSETQSDNPLDFVEDEYVNDETSDYVLESNIIPADEILNSDGLPVYGEMSAPYSLIYFYTYDCPPCAAGDEMLREVLNDYPEFKVVYRDLTVEDSAEARMAMATWLTHPEHFDSLHGEFLNNNEVPTPEEMTAIMSEVMSEETANEIWAIAFNNEGDQSIVTDTIFNNRQLGETINFDRVPRIHLNSAFTFFEVLPDEDSLREALDNFLAEEEVVR